MPQQVVFPDIPSLIKYMQNRITPSKVDSVSPTGHYDFTLDPSARPNVLTWTGTILRNVPVAIAPEEMFTYGVRKLRSGRIVTFVPSGIPDDGGSATCSQLDTTDSYLNLPSFHQASEIISDLLPPQWKEPAERIRLRTRRWREEEYLSENSAGTQNQSRPNRKPTSFTRKSGRSASQRPMSVTNSSGGQAGDSRHSKRAPEGFGVQETDGEDKLHGTAEDVPGAPAQEGSDDRRIAGVGRAVGIDDLAELAGLEDFEGAEVGFDDLSLERRRKGLSTPGSNHFQGPHWTPAFGTQNEPSHDANSSSPSVGFSLVNTNNKSRSSREGTVSPSPEPRYESSILRSVPDMVPLTGRDRCNKCILDEKETCLDMRHRQKGKHSCHECWRRHRQCDLADPKRKVDAQRITLALSHFDKALDAARRVEGPIGEKIAEDLQGRMTKISIWLKANRGVKV